MTATDGKTIFIRKTTAIWLLQEGEQVSSDHRFGVRLKQPYNSKIAESATSSVSACGFE